MTNVVLFCGGRGSSTIISALAQVREVRLTAVVNAYDSGLSTGRVRDAVPGLLGPSDVRKNLSNLARVRPGTAAALCAELMEHRLPAAPASLAASQFAALLDEGSTELAERVRTVRDELPADLWTEVRQALRVFARHVDRSAQPFDFADLAVGNAVMAGFFLMTEDFAAAVASYSALFGVSRHRVVNVTQGEDLWLSAQAGEFYCPDEGVLVADAPPSPIDDLFLLPRSAHRGLYPLSHQWLPSKDMLASPRDAERLPMIHSEVADLISAADVIVYGPGTQHSSLLPSYLTRGLAEAIAANGEAEKLLFLNAGQDNDQHPVETDRDYVAKLHFFLTRRHRINLPLGALVSEVVASQHSAPHLTGLGQGVALSAGHWTLASGKHSGAAATRKILSAASSAARRRRGPVCDVA